MSMKLSHANPVDDPGLYSSGMLHHGFTGLMPAIVGVALIVLFALLAYVIVRLDSPRAGRGQQPRRPLR
jgi:hypothetical protein